MLTIRREQMDAFEAAAVRDFERRMLAHVKEHLPKHHAVLGEEILRRVIRYGIGRAEAHGFTAESDVCLYITLMLMLGSRFDEDPQLPWAEEILQDKSLSDPEPRIGQLHDRAMDYLDEVEGDEGEFWADALRELHKHPVDDAWLAGTGSFEQKMLAGLRRVWPAKVGSLGEPRVRLLIDRGRQTAERTGLAAERGAAVCIVLMFLLGAGFIEDPQFPWAAGIVNEPGPSGRATRADRLQKEAIARTAKWLA